MSLLTRFDTPASLRDMPEDSIFYQNWHDFVSIRITESTPGDGGIGEFYNPSKVEVDVVGNRSLVWMAMPRDVIMPIRDDRDAAFQIADDRDSQNEYCEWRVSRDDAGKITKIVFVTESPEYWEKLWEVDRSRVVELYRMLVRNNSVSETDLADAGGGYRRRNRWNESASNTDTNGIVHLIQRINTLEAALDLSQGSVLIRRVNDNYERAGLPLTSVDPRVELDISSLVRKDLSITLRDPIGLYIVDWDDTGWTKPNGEPVSDYWTIARGRPGEVLRLEYEVPDDEGFEVGDILIGGRPILWGGQVAEHVTVSIVGTAGTRVSREERARSEIESIATRERDGESTRQTRRGFRRDDVRA